MTKSLLKLLLLLPLSQAVSADPIRPIGASATCDKLQIRKARLVEKLNSLPSTDPRIQRLENDKANISATALPLDAALDALEVTRSNKDIFERKKNRISALRQELSVASAEEKRKELRQSIKSHFKEVLEIPFQVRGQMITQFAKITALRKGAPIEVNTPSYQVDVSFGPDANFQEKVRVFEAQLGPASTNLSQLIAEMDNDLRPYVAMDDQFERQIKAIDDQILALLAQNSGPQMVRNQIIDEINFLDRMAPVCEDLERRHEMAAQAVISLGIQVNDLSHENRALESQIAPLRSENESLRRSIGPLTAENDSLRRSVEPLKAQVAGLKAENDNLQRSVRPLQAQVASLLTENDNLRRSVEQLNVQISALITEKQTLAGEVESYKLGYNYVYNQKVELEKEVARLTAILQRLKSQIPAIRTGAQEILNLCDSVDGSCPVDAGPGNGGNPRGPLPNPNNR